MNDIRSYRDLIVWQKAISLAKSVYLLTASYPKDELYGLVSQMRRAAVSISANIAEGQARNTSGEFKQFLGIAKGSLAELDTLLVLSNAFGYVEPQQQSAIFDQVVEIAKMLNSLIKAQK
jgi:four helix bundle protein